MTRIDPARVRLARAQAMIVRDVLAWGAGGWLSNEGDAAHFRDAAGTITDWLRGGRIAPDDWDCCPLCQETDCDDDCPLRPVRSLVEETP